MITTANIEDPGVPRNNCQRLPKPPILPSLPRSHDVFMQNKHNFQSKSGFSMASIYKKHPLWCC